MLDAWASVCPLDSLVDEVMEAVSSPKCTADGKADAISWMASMAAQGKLVDFLTPSLRAVATGSGDKTAAAREAASKLVTGLLQVGQELLA